MASGNYNIYDTTVRFPLGHIKDFKEIHGQDMALYLHELTHHFQLIATAGGWYLFKLADILLNLTMSHLIDTRVISEFNKKRESLHIPLMGESSQRNLGKNFIHYKSQIDQLLMEPSSELRQKVHVICDTLYQNTDDMIDAIYKRELVKLDLEQGAFLFGPGELSIPVGMHAIMEIMSMAIEHRFTPDRQNKILDGINNNFRINIRGMMLDPRWLDKENLLEHLPLLYCMQFSHDFSKDGPLNEELANKLQEMRYEFDLGMPLIAFPILFCCGYLSLMMCVRQFPHYQKGSFFQVDREGEIAAEPGKIFLTLLNELPQINKILTQESYSTVQWRDLKDIFSYIARELSAIKYLFQDENSFEENTSRFMTELENMATDKSEHSLLFNYDSEMAQNGLQIFKKYWELILSDFDRLSTDEGHLDKVVHSFSPKTAAPVSMPKGNSVTFEGQLDFVFIRYICYKFLFADNLACWLESAPSCTSFNCSEDQKRQCQNAFRNRTDTLSSFCVNQEYIDYVGTLTGDLAILTSDN